MRFSEVLNTIRNTFIRKKGKNQPESNPEVTEEPEAPAKSVEMPEENSRDNLERQIRRYRAFAYHHKKRRIRKKYLKKLLDVSPIDRFIYKVNQGGITFSGYKVNQGGIAFSGTWMNGCLIGVDYSSKKDFSPGCIGSRKMDHGDGRMKGGIR